MREPLTGLSASPMMNDGQGRPSGSVSAVVYTGLESRSARAEPSWASTTASIIVAKPEVSGWFSGVSPVTKSIIVINVAVFLLEPDQPDGNQPFINTYLAASPDGVLHHFRIWQLLTATFLHADHLASAGQHVVFLDRRPGDGVAVRQPGFPDLLPGAAIFSTLAWVLIDRCRRTGIRRSHDRRVRGRHGGGDALHLVLPETRNPAFLHSDADVAAAGDLSCSPPVANFAGGSTDVAVESHLAGAGFAFLFKQFDLRLSRLFSGVCSSLGSASFRRCLVSRLGRGRRIPREPRRAWGVRGKSAPASVIPEEQLDARLDEVLAKIAREGRSGLTEEELRVLQEASRRARIRRSDRI